MGQLEPLIAAALGRSPYDDEVVESNSSSNTDGVVRDGQQYDHRGHPVNPATRQWMRDYVRASNEVMQAAGIIEDTADVQDREKRLEQRLVEENEIGMRRLEIGRIVFIAGVWGVCGFRRRVLLYQTYDRPLFSLLQQQIQTHSVIGLCGAGLPVLGAYQVIDWASYVMRALLLGPYQNQDTKLKLTWTSVFNQCVEFSLAAVLLQFRMFGTLQQLDLIPASQLWPSLRSFIPFSPNSPIQWPKATNARAFTRIMFWDTVAPMALLLGYVKLRNEITAWIYAPIYHKLPRPVNPEPIYTTTNQAQISSISSDNNEPQQPESEDPTVEGEGEPGPLRRQNTMDSFVANREEETETRLGFEFEEATEVGPPPPGQESAAASWSAELRNADPPKVVYHITTLTMLPPLLAADAISLAIAELAILPLEATMVRVLASAYRRSAGLGVEGSGFWVGNAFSWQGVMNVLVIHAAEVAAFAAVWAAYNGVSNWLGGVEGEQRNVSEWLM